MKATRITLDLETYQTDNPDTIDRIRQEATDKQPAGNTLKALKAEWDTTEARAARAAEAIAKTSLDPMLARILCLCAQVDFDEGATYRIDADLMTPNTTLSVIAKELEDLTTEDTLWIGHNIAGFDLAILLNSWRRFKIAPPEHFPVFVRGHWRGRIYDTMQHIPNNRAGFVSLDAACQAFGLGSAKTLDYKGAPLDGSRVAEAYEAGDFALILRYCAADVEIERALYLCLTADGTYGTPEAKQSALAQIRDRIAEIENDPDITDSRKLTELGALLRTTYLAA